MIISAIKGGLGNQLFQYAYGRHLAEIHKTELRLDTSWYGAKSLFPFSLHHLNILNSKCSYITGKEITELSKKIKLTGFTEPKDGFDLRAFSLPDNTYLEGYWTSEYYFNSIAHIIKHEVKNSIPLTANAMARCNLARSTNSVSIHVRRGDRVKNLNTKLTYGLIDVNYYKKAIDYISKRVENPYFIVFTDDPEWAHKNLGFLRDMPNFIPTAQLPDYEDLTTMSQCKHHITVNSSFSWWGAWLSNNHNKIIIRPDWWIRKTEVIVKWPEYWITIKRGVVK